MSNCTDCVHFGPHLEGPQEKFPEPCNQCAEGEKFIEPEKLAYHREALKNVGVVKLDNGTQWPDPNDEITQTALWRMRHAPESVTQSDRNRILRMAEAYDTLVTHPAFTLKEVQRRVSAIRKAIK